MHWVITGFVCIIKCILNSFLAYRILSCPVLSCRGRLVDTVLTLLGDLFRSRNSSSRGIRNYFNYFFLLRFKYLPQQFLYKDYLFSSLNVRYRTLHPYKTTGKKFV